MGDAADAAAAKVPNPYLAAIRSARGRSAAPADTLDTALDKAVTAMEAGAWIGGQADTLAGSLSGWRQTARHAATTAMDEFDDAIAQQPEMVETNAWQVHWHNLRPT